MPEPPFCTRCRESGRTTAAAYELRVATATGGYTLGACVRHLSGLIATCLDGRDAATARVIVQAVPVAAAAETPQ